MAWKLLKFYVSLIFSIYIILLNGSHCCCCCYYYFVILSFLYRENDTYKNIEEKDYVIDSNRIDCKVKKSKKGLMDKHHVEMVWNLLKMKNHENFQDLVSAFKAYKVSFR